MAPGSEIDLTNPRQLVENLRDTYFQSTIFTYGIGLDVFGALCILYATYVRPHARPRARAPPPRTPGVPDAPAVAIAVAIAVAVAVAAVMVLVVVISTARCTPCSRWRRWAWRCSRSAATSTSRRR